MLSLITHEPNFCILREEVFNGKKKPTDTAARPNLKVVDKFEMIYISILREYLEMEFLEIKEKIRFEFNIERIIDDFIFFCFFIGNDFLPSLNTLDINHGSLENIFAFYKEVLPTLDDYITLNGKIDFKKAEKIFELLARLELNALRSQLKKVEGESKQRQSVKNTLVIERKNTLKRKKINEKKENLFFDLKKKSEQEIVNFKKSKINNRVASLKKKYEEETKISGQTIDKFEDQLNYFLKEQLNKQIQGLIHRKDSNLEANSEIELNNESSLGDESEAKTNNFSATNNGSSSNTEGNKPSTVDEKKLCLLFDSDDDKKNKDYSSSSNNNGDKKEFYKKGKTSGYNNNNDKVTSSSIVNNREKINEILKEASQYKNYIYDENYCSDFNILDIEDDDISDIAESDLNVDASEFYVDYEKEYEESQDVDIIFHKKLVEFYITDINKAKAFYYKEKLKIDLETDQGKEQIKHLFTKYFEGLQWVLFYYYRGIQTWRWYYPYHYPPMISDFVNIKDYLNYDIESVFISDMPYNPLESLVMILPQSSKDLIPKCLWSIFDIFPYYFPNSFRIDFNGKKMAWESLVLLPFIEDAEILQEIKNRISYFSSQENLKGIYSSQYGNADEINLLLSLKELLRNYFGKSYVFKLSEANYDVIETVEFEIYENHYDQNVFMRNYNHKKISQDFPTLKTISYNFSNNIKRIQRYSREENKKITIKKENKITLEPNCLDINEHDIENFIKSGIIFADYPMKKEGWIRGIYFNNKYYYLDKRNKISVDSNYKLPSTIKEAIMRICNKKSIIIKSNIYCDIVFMKKIARNTDGSIFKIYNENNSLYVPFELTSLNSNSKDFLKIIENFEEMKKKFVNVTTEFDFSKPVITLCKPAWGKTARINSLVKNTDPNYRRYNDINYNDYYDKKFNFDLQGNDWHVEITKLYNGPLLEVTLENNTKQIVGQDIKFAKAVILNLIKKILLLNFI